MSLAETLLQTVNANAPWLLDAVEANRCLDTELNRAAINTVVGCTRARPLPYTLWSGDATDANGPAAYVSWEGLFNRTYTGRHLPPADPDYVASLPPIENVVALFARAAFIPSTTTSALFSFFAQWFTDSFLRTHPLDRRRNTSNHEIDLCQIYGLDAETARLLREGAGGRLATSGGGLFPPRLCGADGRVLDRFQSMPYMQKYPDGTCLEDVVLGTLEVPDEERARRRAGLYATGLERGNSTILYTAISTIFIREHNRIAALLARAHPGWDDDRLFETARNVNIALILSLTVNEYINHLAQSPFRLSLDHAFAETLPWYRANRIAIEFDLLYRWHSLVPDTLTLADAALPHTGYRFNNAVLEAHGAEAVIAAASRQPAGRIGLRNTPDFLLWTAETAAHRTARQMRVRPFVEYQHCFGEEPAVDFAELAGGDASLAADLRDLYSSVDRVEYLVGLFAQGHDDGSVLPATLQTMVAVDAFSQILTNPLMSVNVYGEDAFSAVGLEVIANTRHFEDLIARNAAPGAEVCASFAWTAA